MLSQDSLRQRFSAMTMQEAYQLGEERLTRAGIEEARLDAWYLLEHVTGIGRAMYYAMPDKQLSEVEEQKYLYYIEERAGRVPLQHLTGVQEFMGLEFRVNEHVLIPRQDTETAVEEALKVIRNQTVIQKQNIIQNEVHNLKVPHNQDIPQFRILDLCTGSGCILLSVLHYAKREKDIKLKGIGADISKEALQVARENAETLHIEAEFQESDLFEKIEGSYEIIISNPPYIRTDVIQTLQEEVREHDPWIALDGKEDGLYFYRKIVDEARDYLVQGGTLIFEIGSDQGIEVSELMKNAGYRNIMVKKDLAGLDRVVIGVYDK